VTPGELRAWVEVLRDMGVRRGVLVVEGQGRVEVEFAPAALAQHESVTDVPAGALVDKDGKPVDLDEGNPWADQGEKVYRANFPAKGA
jgi:hypothetical protein